MMKVVDFFVDKSTLLKRGISGFTNKIMNSKPADVVRNDNQKFTDCAKKGAARNKEFGTEKGSAGCALDLIKLIELKCREKKANFVAKHPKLAKILGKILKVLCIAGSVFIVAKVILIAIAIFPEVIAAFLTAVAAFAAIELICFIITKAFNLKPGV